MSGRSGAGVLTGGAYGGSQKLPELDLSRLAWRKSSWCDESVCIEVAGTDGLVLIRDSKDREAGSLVFTRKEWNSFVERVRNGQI